MEDIWHFVGCTVTLSCLLPQTYEVALLCLTLSWSQSDFVWCWCFVKLLMVNRRITALLGAPDSFLEHRDLTVPDQFTDVTGSLCICLFVCLFMIDYWER